MTIEFESTPEGARQGMTHHQRKIRELLEEETAICEDALEGEYNQGRLDEILILTLHLRTAFVS
ncbi:hypothetical protein F9625_05060 [Escherichia coli]|nr:hypothetical protein [Escherichia coli]